MRWETSCCLHDGGRFFYFLLSFLVRMCQFLIPFTECCFSVLFLFFIYLFFFYDNESQGANSSHMPIAMKVLEESGGQLPPPP